MTLSHLYAVPYCAGLPLRRCSDCKRQDQLALALCDCGRSICRYCLDESGLCRWCAAAALVRTRRLRWLLAVLGGVVVVALMLWGIFA